MSITTEVTRTPGSPGLRSSPRPCARSLRRTPAASGSAQTAGKWTVTSMCWSSATRRYETCVVRCGRSVSLRAARLT